MLRCACPIRFNVLKRTPRLIDRVRLASETFLINLSELA